MSQFAHATVQAFSRRSSSADPIDAAVPRAGACPGKSPSVSPGTIPGAMPEDDSGSRSVRFRIEGQVLEPEDFATPARGPHQSRDVKQDLTATGAPAQEDMAEAPCCREISWAAIACQKDPLLSGSVILQCLLPFAGITGAWACNADAALLGQAYGGMAPALLSGAACLRDADRSWRHARQAERDGASTPSTQEPEEQRMRDEPPVREHSPSRGPVDGWLDDGFTQPAASDNKTNAPGASLPRPLWHPTFTGGLSLAQLAAGTVSLAQETVGWTPWMTLPVAGLAAGLCLCCWGACQSMEKPQSTNAQ